jgi:MFS transporter, ENTS family, enterobactin (siderophore) exporter
MEPPEALLTVTEADRPRRSQASPGLWGNRDFRVFLGGQSISALGDAVSFTALPLLVLKLTGSGVAMGTVGVLQTLPDLIFGLPAGALADRWDRRRMMLYADIGRALLTAMIPLSVLAGVDTMAVILLVTAPINILRVLFMAGFTGAMPALAGREHVGQANGYSEAIFSLSFIAGPAIAGILSAAIGPAQTLAVDALSFGVSATALGFVRRSLRASAAPRDTHIVAEILEGIRYILHERTLRIVIAFWGASSVVSATLVAAVIFYLTVDRAQDPKIIGSVLSAFGVGYLIGAVLTGRFVKRRLGASMLAGNVAQAVVLVGFGLADALPVWLVGAFLAGLSGAFVLVSYITLRATIPPDELLGRVGSTSRMISFGLAPVGLFIGGLALDAYGGRATLVVVGLAILALTLVAALSSTLRGARIPARKEHTDTVAA